MILRRARISVCVCAGHSQASKATVWADGPYNRPTCLLLRLPHRHTHTDTHKRESVEECKKCHRDLKGVGGDKHKIEGTEGGEEERRLPPRAVTGVRERRWS